MMCSGTKYSHENFFIQEMFLIFGYFYSGCSYWGLRLLGLQFHCVSASNKIYIKKVPHVIPSLSNREVEAMSPKSSDQIPN